MNGANMKSSAFFNFMFQSDNLTQSPTCSKIILIEARTPFSYSVVNLQVKDDP